MEGDMFELRTFAVFWTLVQESGLRLYEEMLEVEAVKLWDSEHADS